MPDLSLRLHEDMALAGFAVNIVPPHMARDRQKPARGFRVADLGAVHSRHAEKVWSSRVFFLNFLMKINCIHV